MSRAVPLGGLAVVLALGLCTAAPACGQHPIPQPDLGSMEGAAREKIESMQATLKRLQEPGVETRPRELADAFGYLGQLYHAFNLVEAAQSCYRTSRELAAEDPRWPYYLGLVLYTRGELEPAIAQFERALALTPDDVATLMRLGTVHFDLSDPDTAAGYFERLLALDPESAAGLAGLGKVAAARGDHATAIHHLSQALELQPEATVLHYPLGQAYRKEGDLERARWHLQRRGQQEVVFPDPLGNQVARLTKSTAFEVVLALARDSEAFSETDFLGFALSQLAGVDGAIEQLQRGLVLDEAGGTDTPAPQRGRIHYVLGGLLVEAGRDLEAIEHFRAAVELDERLVDARIKLGNALARDQRLEESLAEFERVLDRDESHPGALAKRAAALIELGRFEAALPSLERLVEVEPGNAEARIGLASLFRRLDRPAAAIEVLRATATLELSAAARIEVHTRLGGLLRASDPATAEGHYRLALESDPTALPTLRGLATLLAQQRRFEEAALQYAVLVTLEPENEVSRVAEATALILSGQNEAARRRLEAGLAVLPDDLSIKDLLARHLAVCPDRSVRDGARAVELARELVAAVPTLESVETLAMAHAEAGELDEAIAWQERLIEDVEDTDTDTLSRLHRHLELYRSGKACCGE